jgi:hypothetical protein
MSYQELILADNPYAYWRFQETSGTTAVDEVGNYDGFYAGSPTLGVEGPVDLAAEFAVVPDDPQVVVLEGLTWGANITSTGISIECWIKPVHTLINWIFFAISFETPTPSGILIGIADDTETEIPGTICDVVWSIAGGDGNMVEGNNLRVDEEGHYILQNLYDAWHHIVVTWDGTTSTTLFYLDGELNKTSNDGSGIPTNFSDFQICFIAPTLDEFGANYTGGVAEFAIYNHVLSPEDILAHYEYVNPAPPPPPPTPPPPRAVTNCSSGLICKAVTRHISCWKRINNAMVAAITVCNQNL